MSDTDFRAPVYSGVMPSPLLFTAVDAGWLSEALPNLSITLIEKAGSGSANSNNGYYRLTISDNRRLFAKIKSGELANKEAKAAELSSELHRLGAASLHADMVKIGQQDSQTVFFYPWLDQVFFDDSLDALKKTGQALAILHKKMKALPRHGSPFKHLIDIWERQIQGLPDTALREEYRRTLSGAREAFSRNDQQIAHNDVHRGNVIFDSSGVAAFIDFEDAVETYSSPLVDVAATLERFCLSPKSSEEKVEAFLASYLAPAFDTVVFRASDIRDIGLCRCYHAIAVLEQSAAPEDPLWRAERRKFADLLLNWVEWEKIIGQVIQRLRI